MQPKLNNYLNPASNEDEITHDLGQI